METMEYTLRPLKADDLFTMLRILHKIGLDELRKCFDGEEVRKAIAAAGKDEDSAAAAAGMQIMTDVASLVAERLPECRTEIYQGDRRASHGDLRGNADGHPPQGGICRFFYAAFQIARLNEQDFFDLLFRRYADPSPLMDGMLRAGQLCDFVEELVKRDNDEQREKVLWEIWLHRVFDKSYPDFVDSLDGEPEQATPEQVRQIVAQSQSILDGFRPGTT